MQTVHTPIEIARSMPVSMSISGSVSVLMKPGICKILRVFYMNKNHALHLREIGRRVGLNESSVTRHLNWLLNEGVLRSEREGNLKKFSVKRSQIPKIFPLFDDEKLEELPMFRKNAVREYIKNLVKKPVFMVVFGSTAKGTFRDESDLDILEVYNGRADTREAIKSACALTGIKVQTFQMTLKQFYREIIERKDHVVQSALNTGFAVFNQKYYYEVVYHE